MPRWLKALPLSLALEALGIVATSCGSSNQAQIRFVHAIQDAPPWISLSTARSKSLQRWEK